MVSIEMHALLILASLIALKTFGISSAARMAITASTPIISINVKARASCLLIGVVWIGLILILYVVVSLTKADSLVRSAILFRGHKAGSVPNGLNCLILHGNSLHMSHLYGIWEVSRETGLSRQSVNSADSA